MAIKLALSYIWSEFSSPSSRIGLILHYGLLHDTPKKTSVVTCVALHQPPIMEDPTTHAMTKTTDHRPVGRPSRPRPIRMSCLLFSLFIHFSINKNKITQSKGATYYTRTKNIDQHGISNPSGTGTGTGTSTATVPRYSHHADAVAAARFIAHARRHGRAAQHGGALGAVQWRVLRRRGPLRDEPNVRAVGAVVRHAGPGRPRLLRHLPVPGRVRVRARRVPGGAVRRGLRCLPPLRREPDGRLLRAQRRCQGRARGLQRALRAVRVRGLIRQ